MLFHEYTKSVIETAAVAVNAGTDLEDGNSYDNNIFDSIDEAVDEVSVCMSL